MRILVKIVVFTAILAVFSFQGCNKENEPGNEEKTILTLSSSSATPGDILTIKLDKNVPSETMDIFLNSTAIQGVSDGDSSYYLIMPVVASGNVSVSIPDIQGSNTLNLEISKYEPIVNPQSVIDTYLENRQSCIDSIANRIPEIGSTDDIITLLNQLKEEWEIQYQNLQENDKEMLAYILQKNMPDPSWFTQIVDPDTYSFEKSASLSGPDDKLIAIAKDFVTSKTIFISSAIATVVSLILVNGAPHLISAALLLVSVTTCIIAGERVLMRARQVGDLRGIAEIIIADFKKALSESNYVDLNLKNTSIFEFINNSEAILSPSIEFRNLSTGDKGIQPDISLAFDAEQMVAQESKKVETLYSQAKEKFSKLTVNYPSYTLKIGTQPKQTETIPVDGSDITIKGVSDSRIKYSTSVSDNNSRIIKITSDENSQINFNLLLGYTRKLDNKEITAEIPCVYKPVEPGSLEINYGNNQTGQLSELLHDSIVVQVKGKDGLPTSGVNIRFYTDCDDCGYLEDIQATTNSEGKAFAWWRMGKTEGIKYAKAKIEGNDEIQSVTFSANAKLIEPTLIYVVSGNYQSGNSDEYLNQPVKVKVIGNDDVPIPGILVYFEPECQECGSVDINIAKTDKNGIAQARWKIGNSEITNKLRAEVMNYTNIQPVYFYTKDNSGCLFDLFTDPRDGKTYRTVKIGNQTWFAENLAYLPSIFPAQDGSYTQPRYYIYDYNGTDVTIAKQQSNYAIYGVLYNWPAASISCPSGWHLPSDDEWKQLEMTLGMTHEQADKLGYRGTDQGDQLKANYGWRNNGNGTNSSCFTAMPGGFCFPGNINIINGNYNIGYFGGISYRGDWWTSNIPGSTTSGNEYGAFERYIFSDSNKIGAAGFSGYIGYSVRCIKD
ncbi:MAG: FISUMP domain-containing protein [Draconibacterium sp.]